jgi:hypothetical protein
MSTETYLETLEREHAAETAAVRELEQLWRDTFTDWKPYMPEEKRFRWWVRTYGLRLMRHAIAVTAANASRSWSLTRLGKYTSGVARNIHEHEQIEQIERNRQRRSGSLVGLEFSRLMVWDYAGGRYWWCLCACGDFIRATVRELQSGQRKDCGCLRRERERISKYREAA